MALRPDQIQHILKLYKIYLRKGYTQAQACEEIGALYDRSAYSIRVLVTRLLADTTDAAQSYFKANALRMAMTVVREGSVQQKMDILERPNIGVLAPKKQNGEGQRGFFLTVSADSCGAVKVGAALIEGVPNADTGSEVPGEDDKLWEESQARLRGESSRGSEELEDGSHTHPRGVQAGPDSGFQGFQVLDGPSPEVLDVTGRVNPAKVMKERGIGRSPRFQAALERAKKRLEDAKV